MNGSLNLIAAAPAGGMPSANLRRWIALWAAMLGSFMAVLNIQITNSSLPDILGTLGATWDEGSWVQTSYLLAEIIIIPLTAWMADVFGTRRYLLANTFLFLVFSVACGFAWNLTSMNVFRVLQGFSGGVLIPMAFTLVLKLLLPAERPMGYAIFGMTVSFAPAIGPTVGGWLTDNYGWPSVFYMNLIPGALILAGLAWGLAAEPPNYCLLRRGDWLGIGTTAVGLGSLIVFLEEGNRNDWFNSRMISTLGVTAAVFLTASVAIELTCREPFLNLRLLTRRNFGLGAVISAVFGFAMYGTIYLLPMYLAEVQGYNAQQIGLAIMWSGAPQLLMMPVAAALLKKIDARLLLTAGIVLIGVSCFMNYSLTNLTAYDQLKLPQIIRGAGMPLVIVPLTTLAMDGIAPRQTGSASALFNMLRNLGGSIGIALLATQLEVREKLHSARIDESVSVFNAATQQRLDELTRHFTSLGADAATAGQQALVALRSIVQREAFVMSYGDAFFIVGMVISAMVLFAWLCRPVKDGLGAAH